jgi:hypothetical protein
MDNLFLAAKAIDEQLDAATALSTTLNQYAQTGLVAEDGVTDPALITSQMAADFNGAVNTVINTEYMTARELFLEEHEEAMANLDLAIDQLTAATAVLATTSAVMDMAASADSTQEQLQVQAALSVMDTTITQSEVNAFNSALGSVETYSQQAGAFLSAANNGFLTSTVNNYAASNNLSIGSYTGATYNVDHMLIMWGGNGLSFYGENQVIDADSVYDDAGIYGNS